MTDSIEQYARDARTLRRRQLGRVAAVLGASGGACVAMAAQMSDIGHAVGFAGTGAALCGGAIVVLFTRSR